MSRSTDDFIRSTGNLAFTNLVLKYCVMVLGLVAAGEGVALALLSREAGKVRTVPIFVDRTSGDAKPVDFSVVDAQGEERVPAEVQAYTLGLVNYAYTFNRFTVKSNLEKILTLSTREAAGQLKAAMRIAERADAVAKGHQGLVEVISYACHETRPNIRVQAIFRKREMTDGDETVLDQKSMAFVKYKPVPRTVDNPHGLVVIEYNETPFQEAETKEG